MLKKEKIIWFEEIKSSAIDKSIPEKEKFIKFDEIKSLPIDFLVVVNIHDRIESTPMVVNTNNATPYSRSALVLAPAEKVEKFYGVDFKRRQKNIFFTLLY